MARLNHLRRLAAARTTGVEPLKRRPSWQSRDRFESFSWVWFRRAPALSATAFGESGRTQTRSSFSSPATVSLSLWRYGQRRRLAKRAVTGSWNTNARRTREWLGHLLRATSSGKDFPSGSNGDLFFFTFLASQLRAATYAAPGQKFSNLRCQARTRSRRSYAHHDCEGIIDRRRVRVRA